MGIRQTKTPPHWNYFLSLEDDISKMSRWIEIDKANSNCYSLELARLLMVASAEIDVVAKALCERLVPNEKAASINAYQSVLTKKFPKLYKAEIKMPQFGLSLKPWDAWKAKSTPPLWWTANNKVKHHRAEHFKEANLKNVLNSVAGLLLLLMLYYKQSMQSIRPAPKLFAPSAIAHLEGDLLVFQQES